MAQQGSVQYSEDGRWWWDGTQWQPVAGTPEWTPLPIPPAVLAHLLTGQLDGTNAAATKARDRACHVIAAGFINLQDRGLLTLTPNQSKKLFITFNSVKVAVTDSGRATAEPGIQGALLQYGTKHDSVNTIVDRWIASDHRDPWNYVVGQAVIEATQYGLYDRVDAHRNFVAAAFKGSVDYQFHPERLAAIQDQVDALVARWARLRSEQAELHKFLLDAADAGIRSRQLQDRTDDI